jgi:hypothetical protein
MTPAVMSISGGCALLIGAILGVLKGAIPLRAGGDQQTERSPGVLDGSRVPFRARSVLSGQRTTVIHAVPNDSSSDREVRVLFGASRLTSRRARDRPGGRSPPLHGVVGEPRRGSVGIVVRISLRQPGAFR